MANENYEGFDLTIYNLFTLLREMYYTRGETETNFLSKSGGTLGGSLTIQGNLTVQGNSYKIDTEDLVVKDYTITLAKDNEQALLSMVGMVVPKYDGTNYGFFGWDADGYAYVGDLDNWDGSSAITLANNSSLQKIATIKDTATGTTSDDIMVYDQTNKVFKKAPSGRYVIEDNELVASNDNNALYNLGAFDTISGNTITRQTRYVVIKGDTFNWDSDNPYSNFYGIFYSNALPDIVAPTDGYEIPKMSARGWNVYAREDVINHNQGITIQPSGNYLMIRDTSCSTKAELIAKLNANPIYIEYQSTTYNYIEDVIENQPLLNLDSNGCNFLREEWEKGLNLWNYQGTMTNTNVGITATLNNSVLTLSGTNDGNGGWTLQNIPLNLKAGTYTIKYNGTNLGFSINIYDSSDNLIQEVGYNTEKTFTISTNATHCSIWITGNGRNYGNQTIQIMLNEGSHPYPYQKNNGAIVHKVDIEPVLLWENSSPTSSFATLTNETIKSTANFKYGFIYYKMYKTTMILIQKVSFDVLNTVSLTATEAYSGALNIYSRTITFNSATSINIDHAYNKNGTQDDDRCIPVAIYGTNVL